MSEFQLVSCRRHIKSIINGTTANQIDYEDGARRVTRIETISNGEIDFARIGYVDQKEDIERYKLERGDLLLSHINSMPMIGNCAIYEGGSEIFVGMNLLRLRPSSLVLPKFLFYCFRSNVGQHQVKTFAKPAINQASISTSNLKRVLLPLPHLQTQKTIADFLDRETARIDQLIEKKERLVRLLGEKWNTTLTHLTTKGLGDAKVVPSRNRWIGKIPEHWKIVRLKHLLANDGAAIKPGPFGSDLRSNDMEGDYATVINQRAVLDGDFSRKVVAVTKEKYEALRSFSVRGGDVLLTSRGTIGRATIVSKNVERAIIHPCVIRLRLNETKISPEYFLYLLSESAFLEQVLDLSNATTIEGVRP